MRLAHLYAGLALSLLLFVLALTGSALAYKDAYWRLVYPELRGPSPELGNQERAAAITAAAEHFGDRLRSVKMPVPGVAAYHLYLEGGEAFLSLDGARVIDEWQPRDRLMALLFDLHAHLLAGEAGERVGGVIALLGAALVVTGVVLWWPARRRFGLRHALPSGWKRRWLIQWHRDLGALFTPLLAVLLLTGAGIVFYEATGRVLHVLLPDGRLSAAPAPATPFLEESSRAGVGPGATGLAGTEILSRVHEAFPDARLVFYYPPSDADPRHGFRLQRPCEIHPNGRSYLYLDAAGGVIERTDACAAAPADRTLHALYPLHAGKTGGEIYRFLTFMGGLALAALALSGAAAYLQKLSR